jgi:hypothetical protein
MTYAVEDRNDCAVTVRVRAAELKIVRDAVEKASRLERRNKTEILKHALLSGLGLQQEA